MVQWISAGWSRVALAIALIVFWAVVVACIWRGGRAPAILTGMLLTLYLLPTLYALFMPVRERDPAMGAAVGVLIAIVTLVLTLIALLILGVALHRSGMVWTAFILSLLPALAVTAGLIAYLIGLLLNRQH